MKNNTRTKITKTVNWTKIAKLTGGIVAFLGVTLMIGVCGSLYLNSLSFKDAILLILLGLSLFVGGCFVVDMNDYEIIECEDEDEEFPDSVEELIGAMAYNPKYHSWMTIVNYHDDENWTFVLCSRTGRPESTPIRTHDDIMNYRWTI